MSGIFSKPKTPPPPEPTPMVDEVKIAEAKKKTSSRLRSGGGRDGTILSGNLGGGEKLGD